MTTQTRYISKKHANIYEKRPVLCVCVKGYISLFVWLF